MNNMDTITITTMNNARAQPWRDGMDRGSRDVANARGMIVAAVTSPTPWECSVSVNVQVLLQALSCHLTCPVSQPWRDGMDCGIRDYYYYRLVDCVVLASELGSVVRVGRAIRRSGLPATEAAAVTSRRLRQP